MGETVLIVDDDSDVREVASAAPTRCGYSAVDTGDPQRALGIVREQPDLLLTDVIMPLMKGTELADRVQAVSPRTRVLLMSGYQTADIAPSGRAFMAKPFDPDTLARRVRETIVRPSAFARAKRGRQWTSSSHLEVCIDDERRGDRSRSRLSVLEEIEQPGSRARWISATLEAHGRKTLASKYNRFMALYRDATRPE